MVRSAALALSIAASIAPMIGCSSSAAEPAAPVADAAPVDSGPPADKTTGLSCKTDQDCDKTGNEIGICAASLPNGSLYPEPVCIGTECDVGDGTRILSCDGGSGLCVATGTSGICLPQCDFDDSGAVPNGCGAKNGCWPYGWGKDEAGALVAVGYCWGGCGVDADCPTGQLCQREDGLCTKKKVAYTKLPGEACTEADAGSSTTAAKCNCLYTSSAKAGYCTTVCKVGESGWCGDGFTCDPGLPKTALFPDDIVFTKVPTGMVGYCLKNCDTDADCAGLNAHCDENAGVGRKTCQIGVRRCATNAHCPSGQTCTGATTDALGTCG